MRPAVKAKALLLLYIAVVAVVTVLVLAPVAPETIVLSPHCVSFCPDFEIGVHAYVSLSYYAGGVGTVLVMPGWYYSFHWSPWHYLAQPAPVLLLLDLLRI